MVTRRSFAGFVPCLVCAASGLLTAEAWAQGAAPASTPGVTRKILSQRSGPAPGYVTIIAEATIEPGASVARHTHPGIESGYLLEGEIELPIEGQPTRVLKVGDAFQVPTATPHAGGKPAEARVRIVSTYVVEEGKPLASPA
ncbi:MAG: cupin domain-containing protein [Acetobacteraceae bacterium]|nr:cupin domain-containing protein [Acetobacteraceae bacterium]